MEKTLYFEGAGCVPANDVENCRIRTTFTSKEGKKIYIGFSSGCKNTFVEYGKNGRKLKHPKTISEKGYISCDSCHYITDDPEIDDENRSKVGCARNQDIESMKYTKENILKFVNTYCNADFTKIVVLDDLSGFRVFAKDGYEPDKSKRYNFGDQFQYNKELTEKRIAKVKELKEHFCKVFNQEYDNTSYFIRDGKLIARINQSDEKRIEAGYLEREFIVEV